jgi:hypothetical protein
MRVEFFNEFIGFSIRNTGFPWVVGLFLGDLPSALLDLEAAF